MIFVLPPWRSKLCSWMISSCESFERVYCWYFRLCRAADPGSPKNILFWKVAWILNEILASDFPPGSIFSVRLDMLLPPPPLKIDLFSHVFSSEKIGAEILREQLVEQKAWMSRMVAISVCVVAGTWHRCARWDLGSSANLFPNKLSWLLLLLWQNIWVYGDLVQMGQTEVKMPLEIQWKLTHTVCLPLELESLICLESRIYLRHLTHTHTGKTRNIRRCILPASYSQCQQMRSHYSKKRRLQKKVGNNSSVIKCLRHMTLHWCPFATNN